MKKHTLKWFTNRIGKTVFRNAITCPCSSCKSGTKEGILIGDEQHAEELHMVQFGLDIDYRDKK